LGVEKGFRAGRQNGSSSSSAQQPKRAAVARRKNGCVASFSNARAQLSTSHHSKSEMIMLDKIEEEAFVTVGGAVRVCCW
jgi:hypothetical protein